MSEVMCSLVFLNLSVTNRPMLRFFKTSPWLAKLNSSLPVLTSSITELTGQSVSGIFQGFVVFRSSLVALGMTDFIKE